MNNYSNIGINANRDKETLFWKGLEGSYRRLGALAITMAVIAAVTHFAGTL